MCYFPEILGTEVMVTVAIMVFAGFVLVMQIRRLGERRQNEGAVEVAGR